MLLKQLRAWLSNVPRPRITVQRNPGVDVKSFISDNQVPGIIFKGDANLMRRLHGAGKIKAVYPTIVVINEALEVVYIENKYRPTSFKQDLREAIDCNTSYCDPHSKYSREKHKYEGMKVDDIDLPDLDGNHTRLSDLINEHSVLVIDFWATWCKPCLVAFNDLRELHHEYKETGVTFASINMD